MNPFCLYCICTTFEIYETTILYELVLQFCKRLLKTHFIFTTTTDINY